MSLLVFSHLTKIKFFTITFHLIIITRSDQLFMQLHILFWVFDLDFIKYFVFRKHSRRKKTKFYIKEWSQDPFIIINHRVSKVAMTYANIILGNIQKTTLYFMILFFIDSDHSMRTVEDLRNVANILSQTVTEKNLALSHQKNANK